MWPFYQPCIKLQGLERVQMRSIARMMRLRRGQNTYTLQLPSIQAHAPTVRDPRTPIKGTTTQDGLISEF